MNAVATLVLGKDMNFDNRTTRDVMEQQLHIHWARQLLREHQGFNQHYNLGLTTPVISVQDLPNLAGLWDPARKIIVISLRVIQNYSWNIVLEVLRHEMAHQFITERSRRGRPHGEEFKEACRRLALEDWAISASGTIPADIPHWKFRSMTEDEERLLKRAEKLLALANSDNEHEALLAMQKVQEMYTRYNLDRLTQKRESVMVSIMISLNSTRLERYVSVILNILQSHYFVNTVICKVYNAKKLREELSIDVLGAKENVLMAEYVFNFLIERIGSLWARFKKANKQIRNSRGDYTFGVAMGFRTKLDLEKVRIASEMSQRQENANSAALLKIGSQEVKAYVDFRYPSLTNYRSSRTFRDGSAYSSGVSDGKDIVLRRGIESGPEQRGNLLPE